MQSIVAYAAKCLLPVSEETMSRLDYFLFTLLWYSLHALLGAWLALPSNPSHAAVLGALEKGTIPLVLLFWMWLCATLNRAADAGVTRSGFAKVFFVWPILAVILFAIVPSTPTMLIVLAVLVLPTLFLFLWPSRYA
jgi:hypothetical protein